MLLAIRHPSGILMHQELILHFIIVHSKNLYVPTRKEMNLLKLGGETDFTIRIFIVVSFLQEHCFCLC